MPIFLSKGIVSSFQYPSVRPFDDFISSFPRRMALGDGVAHGEHPSSPSRPSIAFQSIQTSPSPPRDSRMLSQDEDTSIFPVQTTPVASPTSSRSSPDSQYLTPSAMSEPRLDTPFLTASTGVPSRYVSHTKKKTQPPATSASSSRRGRPLPAHPPRPSTAAPASRFMSGSLSPYVLVYPTDDAAVLHSISAVDFDRALADDACTSDF